MSLHFILDGYNIIKSGSTGLFSARTLEEQRTRLLTLIRERRPQGSQNNQVTVVFDSRTVQPEWVDSGSVSTVWGIRVMFSGGTTADETIQRLVEEAERAAEIVIVSNDRGIRRLVGGLGARFMSVEEFVRKLDQAGDKAGGLRSGQEPFDDDTRFEVNDEFSKRWLK